MFTGASRFFFWSGAAVLLFGSAIVCNASAVYLESDAGSFLMLAAVAVVAWPLAAVLKLIGKLRKEPSMPYRRVFWTWVAAALLCLLLTASPTIRNQYLLYRYGITAHPAAGGTVNFVILQRGGVNFCTFYSSQRMKFTDLNGDGHADIELMDGLPGDRSRYDPVTDRFSGCAGPQGG